MERFLVMLLFRFFNIFTSSYLEGILSGSGVNLELAKVSVPSLNNFIKLGPMPPSERRTMTGSLGQDTVWAGTF